MKLIAQLKLVPTPEQHAALLHTLEQANAACNEMSTVAWETQTFRKFDVHHRVSHPLRDTTALSSQMIIRCVAKVADAYRLDKQTKRTFATHGAIAYDLKILRYVPEQRSVSIWTIAGRQTIPFQCGPRQWELLRTQHGETELAYVNGAFYLMACCDVEEPTPDDVAGVLGVDLGIVNLATDNDGTTFSGAAIEKVRQHHQCRRNRLQRVGTRSAKRRLKRNSGRQARFQKNTNHVIAKTIVANAKPGTLWVKRLIAVEELTGIQQRVRVPKAARAKQGNWAFHQLRTFIQYKAKHAGVTVQAVDAHYTSQTCTVCGACEKANRSDQATFLCIRCGHSAHADVNAACNIKDRAVVSLPMVSPPRR